MRKLVRKILEWAVREPERERAVDQLNSASVNDSRATEVEELRQWHGQRIENLEETQRLLMNHLGLSVVNKGRQIVEVKALVGYLKDLVQ